MHVRLGKEAFVLQHSLPILLFEPVQIRAASDRTLSRTSFCDSDATTAAISEQQLQPSTCSISSAGATSPSSSVRSVVARANAVLGTAAVKPYSLWGLGSATSSHRDSTNRHSHGYGRYQRRRSSSTGNSSGGNNGSIDSQGDEALQAQDMYRHQQQHRLKNEDQMRQKSNSVSAADNHPNSHFRTPCGDIAAGLDEVGFGAHVDKSVAAAGDQVKLDVFVVKSDLMKIVDIKVSLVETTQIFSLPDCGRPDAIECTADDLVHESPLTIRKPRRRLVETHVVKIAKDYVSSQSGESHTNGNHLKGYFEDYEDLRTAKSLSTFKLSMLIPVRLVDLKIAPTRSISRVPSHAFCLTRFVSRVCFTQVLTP